MDDEQLLLRQIAGVLETQATAIFDWNPLGDAGRPKLIRDPLEIGIANLGHPEWPDYVIPLMQKRRLEPGSYLYIQWKGLQDLHSCASDCLRYESGCWVETHHDLGVAIEKFKRHIRPIL